MFYFLLPFPRKLNDDPACPPPPAFPFILKNGLPPPPPALFVGCGCGWLKFVPARLKPVLVAG
jgi:hypothetical protein